MTISHADRVRNFRSRRDDYGCAPVFWRGITLVWDREQPDMETVFVDDPAQFASEFGVDVSDEAADKLVAVMSDDLMDSASEAFMRTAMEEGFRLAYDPATGNQRWVRR